MRVEAMKLMLNAPGTERLKLSCDEPPSNFAFKFNLRRYAEVRRRGWTHLKRLNFPDPGRGGC